MKTLHIISAAALSLMILSTPALAGHHYHGHGHGCAMGTWDMSEMDADNDGSLSFEEFAEGNQKKLKRGFDMIDANKDGRISTEEWDAFLDVHNMKTS